MYREIKLSSNYQEILSNNWEVAIKDYRNWGKAAEINEYVANLLFRRNRRAYKKLLQDTCHLPKVYKDINTARLVAMLYGLALEGYLKTALIKSRKIKVLHSGKLNSQLTGHNLNKLFNQVTDRQLANKEETILKNLERAIKSGKYMFEKYYNLNPYLISLDETSLKAKDLIKLVKNFI